MPQPSLADNPYELDTRNDALSVPPSPVSQPLELPSVGDVEKLVCARGLVFLVTDRQGDIAPAGARELGYFNRDTRHLSHYELVIENGQLVRLSAENYDEVYNQIDLMLSNLEDHTFLDDPRNFLHVRRRQMLDDEFVETVEFTNYLSVPVKLGVRFNFRADFADIFEVRGAARPNRGRKLDTELSATRVRLGYKGLCGRKYRTELAFDPPPQELHESYARFVLDMPPGESVTVRVHVVAHRSADVHEFARATFDERVASLRDERDRFRAECTRFECDNEGLSRFLGQSLTDLYSLRLQFGGHTILGAGIPWYCAPFGRDALLAAYEALIVNPHLAKESLLTLAALQGRENNPVREEEPGKILHEMRFGEMARAGEIPHTPYYGSVDSTPLFVVVAHATYQVTADREWLGRILPALSAAMGWIDRQSGNGEHPVTYKRVAADGLDNQGWKDSRAGVSFPDGTPADAPIALCEVQGYCIDAYSRASQLFEAFDPSAAASYAARARTMKSMFDERFWLPSHGRYAFALDGKGRPLPTEVSNLGHLLWSGVPTPKRASEIADMLMGDRAFSGYGIRTLSAGQAVYNPLSYHNGTVWPHDNAIIARGFARYGLFEHAERVFNALNEASNCFTDHRLPELFCGIARGLGPVVRYPVACNPQAWAAAAPFLLIRSLLGMTFDAPNQRVSIQNPRLPSCVQRLELHGLRVGNERVSLRFARQGRRCHVDRLDYGENSVRTLVHLD